jgi:hypothetical protein
MVRIAMLAKPKKFARTLSHSLRANLSGHRRELSNVLFYKISRTSSIDRHKTCCSSCLEKLWEICILPDISIHSDHRSMPLDLQ